MMRIGLHAALFATSILLCAHVARAQNPASGAQSVETLRAQLIDVEAKEAELQARVKQLDEEMRPENIERSLALNGSTHPEELREQRRRQLEAEKARVQAQLDLLATSHTRLQTAIATAEATEAARQGVVLGAVITNSNNTSATLAKTNIATASRTVVRESKRRSRTRRKLPLRHRRRSAARRRR